MTYKTYIETALIKFNLSALEIELIMLDNGIQLTDEVDVTVAKKAIHKSLSVWMPVHSSISEGGVSESWNYEAIKIYYSSLCTELGLENVIDLRFNTLKDKSSLW